MVEVAQEYIPALEAELRLRVAQVERFRTALNKIRGLVAKGSVEADVWMVADQALTHRPEAGACSCVVLPGGAFCLKPSVVMREGHPLCDEHKEVPL